MDIGIFGLPKSGKTTLFNALTGQDASVSAYATGRNEPNIAVVAVPDPRVERLTEMFESKKTVHATVRYVDMAGVSSEGAASAGLPEEHLRQLGQTEALLAVIRCFELEGADKVDPAGDLESVEMELMLSDMQRVENRLPRLERSLTNAKGAERESLAAERSALEKIKTRLDEERPLRGLELTPEEARAVRGFQFLSLKPLLVVFNVSEDALSDETDWVERFDDRWTPLRMLGIQLCAQAEMEISRLDDEERAVFLEEYGIERPAADRVIRLSYELLGVISFLTTGPDESRAWTVGRGATAPRAAGVIHSDLERGFIRAETIAYDDLVAAGSMAEARKRGLLRLEGKSYEVQDGDILNIRFSV